MFSYTYLAYNRKMEGDMKTITINEHHWFESNFYLQLHTVIIVIEAECERIVYTDLRVITERFWLMRSVKTTRNN